MIFDTSEIKEYYLNECSVLGKGTSPHLACIFSLDDPSSSSFVKSLQRAGDQTGIVVATAPLSSLCRWEPTIQLFNADYNIHGILLISPPAWLHNYHNLIVDSKNVEGNDCDDRIGRISCTAQAIVVIAADMVRQECDYPPKPSIETKIIDWIEGQNVVIVGYGKAVGKPLSYLFMRYHAGSVTTIHKYTPPGTAFKILHESDIIVSATGNPDVFKNILYTAGILPSEFTGKYIIDAGITEKDGKIVGDIETEKFADKNMITKVPGGVGAVTTAIILHNTVRAARGTL